MILYILVLKTLLDRNNLLLFILSLHILLKKYRSILYWRYRPILLTILSQSLGFFCSMLLYSSRNSSFLNVEESSIEDSIFKSS